MPRSATVTWTPPGGAQRSCTFAERCTVGRGLRNRILLTESGVSRAHAVLSLAADGLYVRNLSTTQDVTVNGTRLGPGGTRALQPGDGVGIGATVIDVAAVETDASTVRCVNPTCRRDAPVHAMDCPWCGTSLAFAATRPGGRR